MTKLKISKSDRALIAEYGPLSNPVENTLMLRIEAATNAPLARVNNQVVDDPSKVPQGPWISTPLVDPPPLASQLRGPPTIGHCECGSVLSAVTGDCVRGQHCPAG